MRSSFCFPRERRLQKRRDFVNCYETGTKFHTAHFILYVCPGTHEVRFGLTVSRKVGNAVSRARVKRIMRESLRHFQGCLSGKTIVIVAKKQAASISPRLASAEIYPLLQKLQTK